MSTEWISVVVSATAVLLTLLTLVGKRAFKLGKWFWDVIHRTEQFLEDWNGSPARPGVPDRPGMMTRMQSVELDLASVKAEVNYNSGSTVKDAVRRIDQNVIELMGKNTGVH